MKFLLDESADYPLASFLRELGHDVTAIAHEHPASLRDDDVLAIAFREGRVLITTDRDFGELIFRRRLPHAGVLLFRLGNEEIPVKAAWLSYTLAHFADELTQFIVITENGVRVRHSAR